MFFMCGTCEPMAPEGCTVTYVPAHERPQCVGCGATFWLFRRPRNCGSCGEVYCAYCIKRWRFLPELGYGDGERRPVCGPCEQYWKARAAQAHDDGVGVDLAAHGEVLLAGDELVTEYDPTEVSTIFHGRTPGPFGAGFSPGGRFAGNPSPGIRRAFPRESPGGVLGAKGYPLLTPGFQGHHPNVGTHTKASPPSAFKRPSPTARPHGSPKDMPQGLNLGSPKGLPQSSGKMLPKLSVTTVPTAASSAGSSRMITLASSAVAPKPPALLPTPQSPDSLFASPC
eukprot:Hpha_TRINITY_DN15271_c4_g3::TRINITY_DN15271_c4_g3_i1::g.67344::m.67344